jgi:hypothetical protein
MTGPSFGRRTAGAKPVPAPLPVMSKFSRPGNATVPAAPPASVSLEEELKAWKKTRGPSRHLKLLALTASLCFGIASFVLPAAVNDWVQYPLYALSVASLYAGFRRGRITADKARPDRPV